MMDSTIQWNNRAHVRITYEKWYLQPIDICHLLNKDIALTNLNKGREGKRSEAMKKVCYWCASYMGEKDGHNGEGVFHSLCDECARRLRLEERLPELLWAVAALRKQNSRKEQYQTLGVLTTARQKT